MWGQKRTMKTSIILIPWIQTQSLIHYMTKNTSSLRSVQKEEITVLFWLKARELKQKAWQSKYYSENFENAKRTASLGVRKD